MKWLEIIELRSVGVDNKTVEVQVDTLLRQCAKSIEADGIRSYRRVTLNYDFSIHLFHETEHIERYGSELGLHLVSALREFGMINHSVWEETGKTEHVVEENR